MAQAILVVFLFIALFPVAVLAGTVSLSGWKLPAVTYPEGNPYTKAKARLGRQLFFDPRLSSSRMHSCATCHHPGLGWADGLPYAMGAGQALSRHTPSLVNIGLSRAFFWDGRAATMEQAIEQHLLSPGLMYAGQPSDIAARIGGMAGYRKEFRAVFGPSGVILGNIAAALATFVRGIVVDNTPFDRWVAGDVGAMPDTARRGFALFTGRAGCVRCHTPPTFSDSGFHNTGLNSLDPGRFEIQRVPVYRNAFKTPQLRQIALTAPYMHDGSKTTLMEVVDFYNRGGDRPGSNNELTPLHLSLEEKQDLVAFLKSLTGKPAGVILPPLPRDEAALPARERGEAMRINRYLPMMLQRAAFRMPGS